MENQLFEKTSVPKAYMTLALPVVLSMMVSLVYNMVDTFFIALTGNQKRLKEILRFSYLLEMALGLVFTIGMSISAPQIIRIFMKDTAIITNGSLMLRCQQLGMTFMAITLVSTCVCQSVGNALGAFILSISRQGVLYVIALAILSHAFGYTGVLISQACADVATAVLAGCIIFRLLKKTYS